jgi:acetyltransferase
MIQSAGFAEIGHEGRDLQDRCTAIAKKAGIRIWGPNCMGLVDIPRKYFFTFTSPAVYEGGLIPGRISLIVQSGMLAAVFLAELKGRGIGVSKACSIGNRADVDECDLLKYLLTDPETDVVALYLESIPRGRLFAEIAGRAAKPIVVLKAGRSAAGARAAVSHTSSLAGNSRLLDGVLEMSGVTLADDIYQMMDLANALATIPHVPPACRTAILTLSGGAGILACDALEKNGLNVARLSEKTKQAFGGIFPDWMPVSNPVDLFPASGLHGRIFTYHQAISIVLEDPNVDVLLIHFIAGVDPELPDLDALKEKADSAGKVLFFWVMGRQEASRSFRQEAQSRGIAVHREIVRAVECLSAASRFRHREEPLEVVDRHMSPSVASVLQESPLGSSEERVWDEHESKRLLAAWRIPVVEEKLVRSLPEAREAARDLGFPVVLKGLLPGVVHKTEQGLIHLGITAPPLLEVAYRNIQEKLGGRGRILMQRQVETDYELIAGFVRDEQFGPCIMFGLGGVLAELEPDVVFALAPLRRSQALELMEGIRGRRLLKGFRGMAPLREELMAEILINLGNLGTANSQIQQIDINPVAVAAGFPLAVDASIILKLAKNCE